MTTQYSAACYDCTFQSPWTVDRAEADDTRLEHETQTPAHKIILIERSRS